LLLTAASSSSLTAAVNCSGVSPWVATTTYPTGAQVTYNGSLYTAVTATTNVQPDYCPSCNWWQLVDVCGTTPPPTCSAAPAVPTGLSSSGQTTASVNLTWSAVTPPANCSVTYTVYRDGTAVATGLTATSAAIAGLAASTTYAFTVSAVDAAGASAQSAALSVKTIAVASCTAAPAVPTGLAAPSKTSTSVNLTWAAVTPPANCSVTYRVYSRGIQILTSLTGTSTTISNLTAGTTYSFTVAAVDAAGLSSQSTALSVTTAATTPCTVAPAVPTGLAAPSKTNTSANLTWNAATAPAGCSVTYRVYSRGIQILTGLTSTSATVSGLTAGTTYSFTVAAVDAAGISSQSAALAVTTASACAATPAVPTGLASSSQTTSSVNLSWNTVTPPAGCSVTYRVYSRGIQILTGLTGTSTTINNLTANTSYSFTVAAVDAAGLSSQSTALVVSTQGTCTAAPAVPTGLTSPSQTTSSVNLTWSAVTAPANCSVTYNVYKDGALALTVPTTSATITGLTAGSTYSFTVAAVDAAGVSSQGSALSLKIPGTCSAAPAVPTGLASPSQGSSSADLTWNAVTAPAYCNVTYNIYKDGVLAQTAVSASATISGLTANTTYSFTVASVDAAGTSSQGAALSVKTSGGNPGGLTLGKVANPNGRFYAGYYPSWSDNWFTVTNWDGTKLTDDQIYTASHFANMTPGVITHVMISFGQPNFSWNGMTANNWSGTGVNFNCTPADMKEVIRILHILKKKVILAVGGATYNSWGALSAEAGSNGPTKAALTQFMVDLGVDGLDVDYELGDDNSTPSTLANSITNYAHAIQAMREACDAAGAGHLLTIAAWSTGADYTAATGAGPLGISFWGNDAGRERQVFARTCSGGSRSGQKISDIFDVVNVMSYDAQTLHYDPATAFDEYRALVPASTPVSIGLEVPPEGWTGGNLVLNNSDSGADGTFITADQYGRTGRGAYSVERFGNYVKNNTVNANPHDGLMLWQILKTTSPTNANATSASDKVANLFGYVPTKP